MSSTNENIKKKLKNKKKDIISLGESATSTVVTNKIKSQPLSSKLPSSFKLQPSATNISNQKLFLSLTTDNTNLINEMIFEIQIMLSLSPKVDLKLANFILPLLSKEHLHNIIEERGSMGVCGNIICDNKIKRKVTTKTLYYNPEAKEFEYDEYYKCFCSQECFKYYKTNYDNSKTKFDYLNILTLDKVYWLNNLKFFFGKNSRLEKIYDYTDALISSFLVTNLHQNYKEFFQREKLKMALYFIDNFDELMKDEEISQNKEIIQDIFGIEI